MTSIICKTSLSLVLTFAATPAFALGTQVQQAPLTQEAQMQQQYLSSRSQLNTLYSGVKSLQNQLAQLQKTKGTENSLQISKTKTALQSETTRLMAVQTEIKRDTAWLQYFAAQRQNAQWNIDQDQIAQQTAVQQKAIQNQEQADQTATDVGHDYYVRKNTPPKPPAAAAPQATGPIYYDPWNTVFFPCLD